jgi:AcrR family transcriptional regulator
MAYVRAAERRRQYVTAARAVLSRDGVAATSLRVVAAEARVSIGTVYYVFPTKEELITAVIEDVTEEVSAVFRAAKTDAGLDHAIRNGLDSYWEQLVVNDPQLALMRHELFGYALRTPGLEPTARWQMEGYTRIVAEWAQEAANNAGETCAVPFDTLARVLIANVMGLVLHYLSDHDKARSRRDLHAVADMVIALAVPPTTRTSD